MPRLCSSLLLSLLIASSASAVAIDWAPIDNHGNACDPQPQGCFGAVGYAYLIGVYEVTNAQYAEFLNAVAKADTYGLYDTGFMEYYSIIRSGSPGSYSYSLLAGRENWAVFRVSFWDSLRFANWLNNGQPTGAQDSTTTEDGAYTITTAGISNNTITRNPGANVFLPSEHEWYKAAYYDASSTSYFDYPAGSNTPPTCSDTPNAAPNHANCDSEAPFSGWVLDVGSFPGSPSPYGTFDQGGNLWEWNESIVSGNSLNHRSKRGGDFLNQAGTDAAVRSSNSPSFHSFQIGFRVAMIIPEPSTGLLVITGLLGLAGWRRARA